MRREGEKTGASTMPGVVTQANMGQQDFYVPSSSTKSERGERE
jgi:hypothetical protein